MGIQWRPPCARCRRGQRSVTFQVTRLLSPDDHNVKLAEDLRVGLLSTPRWISPIWFYDERGSELFEEITKLPEYYPTARENEILKEYADEIVRLANCDTLIELGAGSAEKSHELLGAMARAESLAHFVAVDVSEEMLVTSSKAIQSSFGIAVTALVADFSAHLPLLPTSGRRLITLMGGTIGNFEPAMRRSFFDQLRGLMGADDALLVGADLVKDRTRLVAAYDDSSGVTAEFNRNALRAINEAFDANFDADAFEHVALFDETHHWIEMRLRSVRAQHVVVGGLDLSFDLVRGEDIRTEISTKFTSSEIEADFADSGFRVVREFRDPANDFQLTLARI
jgi:L-histidine Nalpha-methyltransferase